MNVISALNVVINTLNTIPVTDEESCAGMAASIKVLKQCVRTLENPPKEEKENEDSQAE